MNKNYLKETLKEQLEDKEDKMHTTYILSQYGYLDDEEEKNLNKIVSAVKKHLHDSFIDACDDIGITLDVKKLYSEK